MQGQSDQAQADAAKDGGPWSKSLCFYWGKTWSTSLCFYRENACTNACNNMVEIYIKTLLNIVKNHGHTSSKTMVDDCQTTYSQIVKNTLPTIIKKHGQQSSEKTVYQIIENLIKHRQKNTRVYTPPPEIGPSKAADLVVHTHVLSRDCEKTN